MMLRLQKPGKRPSGRPQRKFMDEEEGMRVVGGDDRGESWMINVATKRQRRYG